MNRSALTRSWGAEPAGENRWRFRLWAPKLDRLDLLLDGRRHAMRPAGDGWFELEETAAPGSAYAYDVGDGMHVPDPAARAQIGDVHGPSQLVDPHAYEWRTEWRGRPWEETILYELHVGTFSDSNDFDGVRKRLDHIAEAGFTAVELCPVAQFAGNRGWGYDGVLPYAPHVAYGGPDGLKRLVDAAHARGLMMFLDVVYNHFGPDGNYLHLYAPDFFHPERHTPWGGAIAFDRAPVRQFFVENALYWLDEYRFDGLRLDATDQIDDPADESILAEIARRVREHGLDRPVHLATEDDRNIVALHRRDEEGRPRLYDGEWNDDFHHVAHVLATGETDGYYADFAEDPRGEMVTALTEGYVQQGAPSPYRHGARRGEPSAELPPTAFVNFLQNHDQTGNRAFGERLTVLAEPRTVEVLTALLMLSPMIPLFFMGEEWGDRRPFLFFCDFHGELADAVRKGRRQEFARWPQFADPKLRETIPDPNDPATFAASMPDWSAAASAAGQARLALFRTLSRIRLEVIAPRLARIPQTAGKAETLADRGLRVSWPLNDGSTLALAANLGGEPFSTQDQGHELFGLGDMATDRWAIRVTIEAAA